MMYGWIFERLKVMTILIFFLSHSLINAQSSKVQMPACNSQVRGWWNFFSVDFEFSTSFDIQLILNPH